MFKIVNKPDFIEASELFESGINYSGSYDRAHYSPSFIKSWMKCPAMTVFGIVFENESPALSIGSAVHSLLEEYYSNNLTQEEVLEKCKSENLDDMDSFYVAKVKEYLRSYFTIESYGSEETSPHLTENEIITSVSPLGVNIPVKLKGFLDRVDLCQDGLYVVDYKTASRKITDDMYIDQMIIYKWLLEKETGEEVKDVYIAAIYKDHSEYIRQDITLRKQSELVDNIFKLDQEVIDSLDSRIYIKREGDHCRFCPMKDNCKNTIVLDIKE